METEGLDFPARWRRWPIGSASNSRRRRRTPEAAPRRQRRQRLQSLLGRAATYYARYLWEAREATPALEYLPERGLREDTLREFRVGYAPSAWDRMLTASRRAGFQRPGPGRHGARAALEDPSQTDLRPVPRADHLPVDRSSRQRVGFGARAMRENQRPKYLNTAEGEIYQKREVLFGIDRAGRPRPRSGRVILVEGYTDVLALHQAGLSNAVGIMGTALTEERSTSSGGLRLSSCCASTADRAGQDAMLRAAQVTDNRNLELRVVPLPEGTDPAELIERAGVDALRERVEASVPFVKFHVERILERNDTSSAEGRDRAFRELQPALRDLPQNAFGQDLLRRVAGRLELSEARLATLIGSSGRHDVAPSAGSGARSAVTGERTNGGGAGARTGAGRGGGEPLDQGLRAERTFLALCVARPQAGARVLFEIDLDRLITSEVMRRAARHSPAHRRRADLPDDDEQLARVVADLVARAGPSRRGQRGSARARPPGARAGPDRPRDSPRQVRGRDRGRRAGARARGGDGGAPDGLRAARKSGLTAPVAGAVPNPSRARSPYLSVCGSAARTAASTAARTPASVRSCSRAISRSVLPDASSPRSSAGVITR